MRIAVFILIGVAMLAGLLLIANRPVHVTVREAVPPDFPDRGFSHEHFERLLQRFVDGHGRVDYSRWHTDEAARADLDSYLAAVGTYSPESTPDRFTSEHDRLAYWMFAYNAWVIRTVLDHWPLGSVTDLQAPIEVVRGLGFFYRMRFNFGGEMLSLLTVENERIRKRFSDPRIHFILNCGGESCPVLRPELPTGSDLEKLLERAANDFVYDRRNVLIDHASGTIYLSAIFKWYEDDYLIWLRSTGRPSDSGLLDYIRLYADEALTRDLAQAEHYAIEFRDFDWTINAIDAAASNATH